LVLSFLLPASTLLYVYILVCWSVYLLKDIWVVCRYFSFWQLWKMVYMVWVNISSGCRLLSHMMSAGFIYLFIFAGFTLIGNSKLRSEWLYHFAFPTA
jgi:hypothetical protein